MSDLLQPLLSAPGTIIVTTLVVILLVAALFSRNLIRARLLALRKRLRPSASVATPDTVAAPLSQTSAPATPAPVTPAAPLRLLPVAPLTRRPALGALSTRRLNRE